jgi:hypothetical protein
MTGLSPSHKLAFLLLLILLLALAFTGFLACGGGGGGSSSGPIGPVDPGGITGSGNIVEESRSVSGFSSVDQAGEGRLYIEHTGSETLRVRADDNLQQHIQTNVVGDELEIRTAPGVEINPSQAIEYFLTVDDLKAAELTGVGRLECAGLSTNRLEVDFSGVGSVLFSDLAAEYLDLHMTGVGDVQVTGEVTEQMVQISGVGDYNGKGLSSSQATVEINGSQSATVRVTNRLVVRIVGSGCVYYIGNPIIESTITGSGCVEKL